MKKGRGGQKEEEEEELNKGKKGKDIVLLERGD